MKKSIFIAAVLAVACAAAFTSCDKKVTSSSTSGIATLVADASFQNIIDDEIGVYEYIYKGSSIIPYYSDEKSAVDSLLDSKTKCIVISRQLNEKELSYLKSLDINVRQHKIAIDAIAVIVNPENPVNVLSRKEIGEILTGKFTSWQDIEPSNLGDIKVVFDSNGSSTVKYMTDSVMDGKPFGPNVGAQGSPQAVFDYVAANRNAIGIIGVNWISSDLRTTDVPLSERAKLQAELINQQNDTIPNEFNTNVKVIKVRGNNQVTAYKPYQAYIYSGEYPLYRPVYMIITATNGTLTHGFYSFVTGVQGQKLIQASGILPAIFEGARMVQLN